MILVIGSAASGKRDYVQSLGFTEADMSPELDSGPVLYDLQALVARDPGEAEALLPALWEKEVVICNEVGSGVIPIDQKERQSREMTGRLCILLAQRAEKVVRLICGVPQIIKE